MVALFFFLLRLLLSPFRPISPLEAENAALRRQQMVLQRQVRGRIQFTNSDRLFFLQLYRWFPSIVEAMLLMDNAEHSTDGAFVNLIAYKSDYVTAQEDLTVIEATARVKSALPQKIGAAILPSNDDAAGGCSVGVHPSVDWP
jgi:hypothetical protein